MNKTLLAFPIVAVLAVVITAGVFTIGFDNTEPVITTQEVIPSNGAKVSGHYTFQQHNEAGELIYYSETDNLIVDEGLDCMGDYIWSDLSFCAGTADFDYLEIGDSATAPTATDTALNTSLCARIQDATVVGSSSVSGEITVTIESAFDGATCTGTAFEVGLFNAVTTGDMMNHALIAPPTVLGSGDTFTVTLVITIT
jgi:hypothetical protein